VVGRNESVRVHALDPALSRVETLFVARRAAHDYSALRGFISCLNARDENVAA